MKGFKIALLSFAATASLIVLADFAGEDGRSGASAELAQAFKSGSARL